ncbi:MAG: VWA domain-containing protein, partial [Cyanobacteria bacterium NC_groundwater_1444_Ag_S-0.65um_54_12]|nr:VWA domain-containing protein [Cyanobacteria bacterium NC_groundwater_1444_Ag_S-0.65um_54_12]
MPFGNNSSSIISWLAILLLVLSLVALIGWRVSAGWHQGRHFLPPIIWQRLQLVSNSCELAIRSGILLAVIAMLLASLVSWQSEVRRSENSVSARLLILLDTSKSMWARDHVADTASIQLPLRLISRFVAAKQLAISIIEQLGNWQVGILVFAGEPLVLCPATPDTGAAITLLGRAQAGESSMVGGTNLERALQASLAFQSSANTGAVLLLTDGEELSGNARKAARLLAQRQIPIHVAGIGRAAGAT